MTEPTEMERRVADVLANESAVWMNCLNEKQALHLARAAIRAILEPNEAMIVAADEQGASYVWRAMIDAASPPND